MKKILSAILLGILLTVTAAGCGSQQIVLSGDRMVSANVERMTVPKNAGINREEASAYQESSSVSESSEKEHSEEENSEKETSKEEPSEKESSEEESSHETGEPVGTEWFDDAVFVGDSLVTGLRSYAENGCLGDADFLAKDCMGFHTAMRSVDDEYGIHPVYNGELVMVDDTIQLIGKKKVFILLGTNDICCYGAEETVDGMVEFTGKILEKTPDAQIYLMSATPLIADAEREDYLNNENIAAYNEMAKQVCAEKGYVFLDVAGALDDGNGNLALEYCGDIPSGGFHFNDEGNAAWVEYLKSSVGGVQDSEQ